MEQSNRTLRKAYESPSSFLFEVTPCRILLSTQQTKKKNEQIIIEDDEWDW